MAGLGLMWCGVHFLGLPQRCGLSATGGAASSIVHERRLLPLPWKLNRAFSHFARVSVAARG